MDIVDRLFELVDEKFKEQKAFAAAIGVSDDTASNWRRRKSASFSKYLPQIANALGTTIEYLLTGNGPKYRDKPSAESGVGASLGAAAVTLPPLAALGVAAVGAVVSGARGAGKSKKMSDTLQALDLGTFRRIPILGRVSAGLPLYAEQHIEGYTVTDLNGGSEYFALIVRGDSMNAIGICDGYRVIVRRQDEVENGQVAVVMVGNEDATVKRFYATGSTVTLMPQSTNPEHQPQIYDAEKTRIRIIGRVVKVEFTL